MRALQRFTFVFPSCSATYISAFSLRTMQRVEYAYALRCLRAVCEGEAEAHVRTQCLNCARARRRAESSSIFLRQVAGQQSPGLVMEAMDTRACATYVIMTWCSASQMKTARTCSYADVWLSRSNKKRVAPVSICGTASAYMQLRVFCCFVVVQKVIHGVYVDLARSQVHVCTLTSWIRRRSKKQEFCAQPNQCLSHLSEFHPTGVCCLNNV
jgi:hypothetical protein